MLYLEQSCCVGSELSESLLFTSIERDRSFVSVKYITAFLYHVLLLSRVVIIIKKQTILQYIICIFIHSAPDLNIFLAILS